MHLPITLTIAAAAGLLHVWLAMRCSQVRIRAKISIGDGGNTLMETRMRSHANFAENMPIFLILLGLVEFAGGTQRWLWLAAIVFVLARIAHAFGMERPAPNPLRAGGMLLTLLLIVTLAVYAIILGYGYQGISLPG